MPPTPSELLVLAGDIGGTNLTLGLLAVSPVGVRRLRTARLRSAEVMGLSDPVRAFLAEHADLGRPVAACFAAAGPLREGRIALTNLPWTLEAHRLEADLDLPVRLLNDFGALVHAALRLPSADPGARVLASRPMDPAGPVLVVGAGTGLGVGYGFREGPVFRVFPSEGGHVALPVFDETSAALHAAWSATQADPPDAEQAVSGPGLGRILAFLLDSGRAPRSPRVEAIEAAPEADRPRLVAEGASSDVACARALAHFLATYARVCADLTAAFLPTGGLFLAGGVTARLAPHFLDPSAFLAPFQRAARPHVAALLAATPVTLLTDYDLSLDGAAWAAAEGRLERP